MRLGVVFSALARPASVVQTAAGELIFRWQTGTTFNQKDGKWVISARAARRVPAQLWKKFIALTSNDPRAVRHFARQFGPLRGGSGDAETVPEWLRFAELGRHIANAAQALTSGGQSDPSDWEALREWVRPLAGDHEPKTVAARKLMVMASVRRWLLQCEWHIVPRWSASLLEMAVCTGSLLEVIGLQLCAEISRSAGKVECSGCGKGFRPTRAVPGQRRFCRTCRDKKLPVKLAMRDYRRNHRRQFNSQ